MVGYTIQSITCSNQRRTRGQLWPTDNENACQTSVLVWPALYPSGVILGALRNFIDSTGRWACVSPTHLASSGQLRNQQLPSVIQFKVLIMNIMAPINAPFPSTCLFLSLFSFLITFYLYHLLCNWLRFHPTSLLKYPSCGLCSACPSCISRHFSRR